MMRVHRPWTRGLHWLLPFVLLAAQGLGLAHRIAHASAAPASAPRHAEGVASDWFDAHAAGGAECRLLDQAFGADGLHGGTPACAPVRPLDVTEEPRDAAAKAARYDAALARGPPRR
jgi:hypothetical protein